MLSRLVQRRLAASLRNCKTSPSPSTSSRSIQRRWITPAPKPGDGPLMSRRADRELPEISQVRFRWGRTLPIFLAIVSVCSISIFNYQKTSSPIVSSTLYALRTNARARAILGDDIYFKHQIPWIRGQMNQMQGRINIYFTVKGTRGWATMRFASHRPSSRSLFETTEWSLTTAEGEWVDLLDGGDPFRGLLGDDGLAAMEEDADLHATRGYRQQGALNK
ncbi:cytochrome oxidase assembly [Metarhizium anisopliae]